MDAPIRIEVLDNGFVVCVANPPPKKKPDGSVPYVEYEERYAKFAAATVEEVLEIVGEALPVVKDQRPDPKQQFSAGFKEATRKDD